MHIASNKSSKAPSVPKSNVYIQMKMQTVLFSERGKWRKVSIRAET